MSFVAIALYDVGVAGHVIAVIAGLGPMFAYPWMPSASASDHHARERLLRRLVVPCSSAALLLGLYLATDRNLLGKAWVLVPLVSLVVVVGTASAVLVPIEHRLAERASPDDERTRRTAGVVCLALIAAAAFLMVTKPS